MRLKSFTAETLTEAMELVRRELGPDALILSTDEGAHGEPVRITAAIEGTPAPQVTPKSKVKIAPARVEILRPKKGKAEPPRPFDPAEVTAILNHHGIRAETAEHLREAIDAFDGHTLTGALSAAFDATLTFSPLQRKPGRPIMLVGPAGAGKTLTCAKLAGEFVLAGEPVQIITTDTEKAGGITQLEHYASLMKLPVASAGTVEDLTRLIDPLTVPGDGPTLIDSRGTNPYDVRELDDLIDLIVAVDAEPLLVLPAGLDAEDAADIGEVFAAIGVRRMIASRIDCSRRFAGLLTAARAGRFALAGINRSPYVADAVTPASADVLARLYAALPPSPSTRQQKAS